ncbi:MAG TPA: protein kinase [Blastocatellia bacterium]|nr:protein kinase [Blastocatellia bacterium]
MTGTTILHYRLGERLGAGGMGEVYRAEDTRLGRQVAVKFLPASYQYDPERRERFYREARAASSLRSANVAAIYDIGEHEGASFIVMEMVEGEVLSRVVERGPLPVCEVIDVTMQIADALDEAHAAGIVHRDIKTSNLMLTDRGMVKVLDFGLAKVTSAAGDGRTSEDPTSSEPTAKLGGETAVGVVLGTVSYMSPEQALGRAVDHRSDIFSLGVVCYEMLTGRLPFDGDSSTEIIDKIVNHEPPAVARFNYSVPQELERILRKTLDKDPNYRYQTARELYIDLRSLRRDLEMPGRTGSIEPHTSEFSPTAVLSAPTTRSVTPAPPKLENAVAVITFSNITKEPSDDWIGSGIAETVTADLKSIQGLSVIGRERIFEVLKNLGTSALGEFDETFAIQIGRNLAASWIIGGGYQRIGEMIRITARFIEVETGALLKSVKIDGKMAEIFVLQDKIVYELSQGLNLKLRTSEITEIERDETQSVEAYEHFSRGMMNLRTGSRETLDRAIHFFEKATELDPGYARAWAALGAAYDLKGSFLSIPELSYKAIEFERKAISLNPRLQYAHQWLGSAFVSIGHYDEAIEEIREAIKLEATNAGAHASLARAYWIGKGMIDEGITELEHAVGINPQQGYAHLQLALLYTLRGNYPRAEAAALEAISMQEQSLSGKEGLRVVGAHGRLGYVYYRQGRYDDAIAQYQLELGFLTASDHALRDRTLIELSQKLGAANLRKGRAEEAEQYFSRAIRGFQERLARGADDPFTKYYVACVYGLRGDADNAVKYLRESLVHLKALNTLRARTDPDFDLIRDDPRFVEVIRE